jgi:hypothetical protein
LDLIRPILGTGTFSGCGPDSASDLLNTRNHLDAPEQHGSHPAAVHKEVEQIMATQSTKSEYLDKYGDKLSDSTKRAQWIDSPGEKPDHDGQTLATRNHDVIKHWAEERGAKPATIEGTEHGDDLGVLRFDFPGYDSPKDSKLKEVSWDEWFKTFDDRKLVMLFQETQKAGNQSNFFRFDSPLREDG